MRNLRLSAALAGLVAVYGFTNVPVAKAGNVDYVNGGACQLSTPTTDTKFRPKATGARNESTTTNSFVICTMPRSTSTGPYLGLSLVAYSLDGTSRTLSCTAVAGIFGNQGYPPRYSTKTAGISDTTGYSQGFYWDARDFGGAFNDPIPDAYNISITCNLPPQTAINLLSAGS